MSYKEAFKIFGDFKTPAFDFNSLFEVQRRNVEATTAAAQIVAEAAQTVIKAQVEALKSNFETAAANAKELTAGGTPDISIEKQANQAKAVWVKTSSNFRELLEIINKSNFEAFDLLSKRAVESFEELNTSAAANVKAAAGNK